MGGSATTPDTCTEICGDGLDKGGYACDDGNIVDGDGCSKTCTIEFGWICYNSFSYLPSFCYKITWPHLLDYYLSKDNKYLYL